MPTTNMNIGPNWTQVASTSDSAVLISWDTAAILEVATTSQNTAPTGKGHKFFQDKPITRSDLGDGFIWARTVAGSFPTNIPAVITTSISSAGNRAYDPADDMLRVKSMQKKFRCSFFGAAIDETKWEVFKGPGGNVTQTGGNLVITSGTTANSETWVLSKETFTIPFRVSLGLMMSQRIANQAVLVEAVSVDPDTGIPDGKHTAALMFSGTSNTSAIYRVQSNGGPVVDSAASTFPNTSAVQNFELEPYVDECWFHGGAVDSSNARTNSYRRNTNIPDPNAVYKLRIRSTNFATAPASSTTTTISHVSVQDYAELTAEITAGRGQSVAGQGVGMVAAGGTLTANEGTPLPPSTSFSTSTAGTNLVSVRNFPAVLFTIMATNFGASDAYLKLYNKTSAPVIGTDNPVQIIRIPPGTPIQVELGRLGIRFSAGMAYAITGGLAANDTTAITAGQVLLALSFV